MGVVRVEIECKRASPRESMMQVRWGTAKGWMLLELWVNGCLDSRPFPGLQMELLQTEAVGHK